MLKTIMMLLALVAMPFEVALAHHHYYYDDAPCYQTQNSNRAYRHHERYTRGSYSDCPYYYDNQDGKPRGFN